jgi:hypothetical protein
MGGEEGGYMSAQKQRQVLALLKAGRSITVGECYYLFHTHDLRRIISRIKTAGYPIIDEYETSPDGKEKYKRFWMDIPQPDRQVCTAGRSQDQYMGADDQHQDARNNTDPGDPAPKYTEDDWREEMKMEAELARL